MTSTPLLLLAALIAGNAFAQPAGERFAPGRLLVQPKAGLSAQEVDRALRGAGGQGRRLGSSHLYVVDVPRGAERAIAHQLARHPHFKFAELDRAVGPELASNDPYAGSQWHLARIGAGAAWDSSQGAGVTIAIIDSGVDATHPDLAARIVAGWNFNDNNADTSDVTGHGTKVAGAAAAITNNGAGVSSVAGQARIMPLRVTDATGYTYWSTVAQAITYAADRGVRVANASYVASGSAAVQSAAQYMKSKGGLVFVSAGNQGAALADAATTSLITVSATDSNDGFASFSNYGPIVRLAAPGSSIYTTVAGGGYAAASGTSFSAPVAAGVAALMMAARPTLSSADVESLLLSSATDLGAGGRDAYFGHGRVDAAAAVRAALGATSGPAADTQAPQVALAAPIAGSSVAGIATVDVSASDNVGVTRVELRVNGTLLASDTQAPFSFAWDTRTLANGTATLEARAYDAAGLSAATPKVTVNVANAAAPTTPTQPDTVAPIVLISNPVSGAKVKGNVTIATSASDNAGAAGISQTLSIDGVVVARAQGGSLSYTWSARRATLGTHAIEVVARDAAGNTARSAVSVVR